MSEKKNIWCARNETKKYKFEDDKYFDCGGPKGIGVEISCEGCEQFCKTRDELAIKIGQNVIRWNNL